MDQVEELEDFYEETDDKEYQTKMLEKILSNDVIDDIHSFYENYESLKETYKTKPYLSKYEQTKIISERAQQLANGSSTFIKNPKSYHNVQEIALQELKEKLIPFIIKRPIANTFEYWKLEDLNIL